MKQLNIKHFPFKLRKLVKKNKVTQKQLSKDINMTETIVSCWMKGTYHPNTKALIKLANYFNVSVDYFLKE